MSIRKGTTIIAGNPDISNTANLSLSNLSSSGEARFTAKQDTLVSGTNIKTLNNSSILGSGNLNINGNGIIDRNTSTVYYDWVGTLAEYNSLGSYNSNWLYYIVDDNIPTNMANTDLNNLSPTGEARITNCANKDLSNLSNLALGNLHTLGLNAIVETYNNGMFGYRVWQDGYCEQWGRITSGVGDTNTNVIFLKAFVDTNYYINLTSNSTNNTFNAAQPNWVNYRATTYFTAHIDAFQADSTDWIVKGFIA